MPRGRYVQNAGQRLARAKARLQGRGRPGATPAGRGRGRGGLGGKSPMPWDSTAQRESAILGNEGADTRAAIEAKYARAQSELGFGAGAENPYSESAENKTQLANNQRGIGTTAGNQLYAGSTLNAQSAARSEYDKTQKGLEDAYAEEQASHTGGLAKTARDEQIGQAGIKEGAIERAAATEPKRLAVGGRGRGTTGMVRGRGRIREQQNVRRPAAARAMNAQARAINARLNSRGRGRVR